MNDLMLVEKLAHWEKLKALVLDSVSSPITKRVYNMALIEFLAWFQQAPRPGFTKATVSAWRVSRSPARGIREGGKGLRGQDTGCRRDPWTHCRAAHAQSQKPRLVRSLSVPWVVIHSDS
jgi:hypothetical protein